MTHDPEITRLTVEVARLSGVQAELEYLRHRGAVVPSNAVLPRFARGVGLSVFDFTECTTLLTSIGQTRDGESKDDDQDFFDASVRTFDELRMMQMLVGSQYKLRALRPLKEALRLPERLDARWGEEGPEANVTKLRSIQTVFDLSPEASSVSVDPALAELSLQAALELKIHLEDDETPLKVVAKCVTHEGKEHLDLRFGVSVPERTLGLSYSRISQARWRLGKFLTGLGGQFGEPACGAHSQGALFPIHVEPTSAES